MTDLDPNEQMKQFYASLMEFAPFSVEPKGKDIENLKTCADMMKDAGDNMLHATSVLTQALIAAGRSVLNKNGENACFKYGYECRLAENEISTEASIARQIAQMLLLSGIVKMEKNNVE